MTEWNDCPCELKEMIVQRATEKTRNALRCCSFGSKHLIDGTKLNNIHEMSIGRRQFENPDKWEIIINKCKEHVLFDKTFFQNFDTFAEFQKELNNIFKSICYIKHLIVVGQFLDVSLNLSPLRSKLRVENVMLNTRNGKTLERILSQFEPVYLKKIVFFTDGGNDKIYDLQQIICAESLQVWRSFSIREDQLLKLQARYISLRGIQCSISEYVKRCAFKASTKLPQFSFVGPEILSDLEITPLSPLRKILLKTDHPQLALQLEKSEIRNSRSKEVRYSLEGRICFDSEITASNFSRRDQSELRKIATVKFYRDDELPIYMIKVKRDEHREDIYKFYLFANAQDKLNEILDNTDSIGSLDLEFDKSMKKPMKWSTREKRLLVFRLVVRGEHSVTRSYELMQQIDPVFLKKIFICSLEVDDRMFNMAHIENALFVDLSGAVFNDAQLLKLKAHSVISSDHLSNGVQNQSLTANGLNQYMKDTLNHLNGVIESTWNIDQKYQELFSEDGRKLIRFGEDSLQSLRLKHRCKVIVKHARLGTWSEYLAYCKLFKDTKNAKPERTKFAHQAITCSKALEDSGFLIVYAPFGPQWRDIISPMMRFVDITQAVNQGRTLPPEIAQGSCFFIGNPLAAKISISALEILQEEKLVENSAAMGEVLMNKLKTLPKDVVSVVRGKGLFCAIVINKKYDAWKVCLKLKENGLLAKNTHEDVIRFAPPLCINKEQVEKAADIIIKTITDFAKEN